MRLGLGVGLSRRRRGGAPWTPASLPDLAVWLTAGPEWCYQDAGASVPCGDGDPVYTWVDRSGNGHDFSQADAGTRPVLRLGSEWELEFPDSLEWLVGPEILGSGESGTAAIVVWTAATANQKGCVFSLGSDSGQAGWCVGFGVSDMDAAGAGTELLGLFGTYSSAGRAVVLARVTDTGGGADILLRTPDDSASDTGGGDYATPEAASCVGAQKPGTRPLSSGVRVRSVLYYDRALTNDELDTLAANL
jgi:hypothetical protein